MAPGPGGENPDTNGLSAFELGLRFLTHFSIVLPSAALEDGRAGQTGISIGKFCSELIKSSPLIWQRNQRPKFRDTCYPLGGSVQNFSVRFSCKTELFISLFCGGGS